VRSYYDALKDMAFAAAWKYLGPEAKAENGGFDTWRDGYTFSLGTKLESVSGKQIDSETASVTVKVRASDIDACSKETVKRMFEGAWTVQLVNGSPLLMKADIQKTRGADPVADPSQCSATSPGVTGGECDESYPDVCLPPYNGVDDINCKDVPAKNFKVLEPDPYNLDGSPPGSTPPDANPPDGIGCEPTA
jgi:hypothetical protein